MTSAPEPKSRTPQASPWRPVIAALLSALVFPGAGLWYLGFFTQMLVFAVPTVFALAYICRVFFMVGMPTLNAASVDYVEGIMMRDDWQLPLQQIKQDLINKLLAYPHLQEALWILLGAWSLSIVFSFIVGTRQIESVTETPPTGVKPSDN